MRVTHAVGRPIRGSLKGFSLCLGILAARKRVDELLPNHLTRYLILLE